MSERHTDTAELPTRRDYVKYSGTVVVGGLLAGCAGDGGTGTEPATTTQADKPEDPSYSVTMAPMGTVEFEAVPETIFTIFSQYADMAVALGVGTNVTATYAPEMVGPAMNHYYHHLDGVSFDWEGLPDSLSDGLPKELLYSLDSDIHLADPAWVSTQNNWDDADVGEIRTNLGPWFGNFYSGTHADPPEAWADRYEYYGLWELFEKVAEVFREHARYEALAEVHSNMLSEIQTNLPPEDERPTVVRVTLSDDTFWTYHVNWPGYWQADTRPLGAVDAFAGVDWGQLWGEVGYEAMLEADPDVILHLWGMTPNYDMREVRSQLENKSVSQQLSAVKNGRVYAHGLRYQGPIMNLFQLEMTAKQLYPDIFGGWPEYQDGEPYPEIPKDEQLFDRHEVADIVHGAV